MRPWWISDNAPDSQWICVRASGSARLRILNGTTTYITIVFYNEGIIRVILLLEMIIYVDQIINNC